LADTEINSYLIERVKAKYPTHRVDGEEEQYGVESDFVWVCDPVDGTAQYARHVPVATFSLALIVKGVTTVGVVYDPFLNELYWAVKGQGAYKNGERLHVSDTKLTDKDVFGAYEQMPRSVAAKWYDVSKCVYEIRKTCPMASFLSVVRSCVAVAEGYYAFAIFPANGKNNQDVAAVKVIVEEAGGIVRNFAGEEERYDRGIINGAIISNKTCYDEVLATILTFAKK